MVIINVRKPLLIKVKFMIKQFIFSVFLLLLTSASAYSQVETNLFEYDQNAPLEIKELKAEKRDSVLILDITYASPKGGRVPAFLVIPKKRGKIPAVVYQHWGVPDGNRSQFLSEAVQLADKGIASILIDAPFARPELNLKLGGGKDADITHQAILDLRWAIDVLETRSEIDKSRIAYIGHSFGAGVGGVLVGVEPRFKGFVLMAGVGDQIEYMRTSQNPNIVAVRKNVPPEALERYLKTLEPLIAEKFVKKEGHAPIFFQFASNDEGISPELSKKYFEAASEPKRMKFYEANHALNEEAKNDRLDWLKEKLLGSKKKK